MSRAPSKLWFFWAFASFATATAGACARTAPVERSSGPGAAVDGAAAVEAAAFDPPKAEPAPVASSDAAGNDAGAGEAWSPPPASRIDGPHEDLRLDAGRSIYYAMARDARPPIRLIGHLHGMCGPPPYACGRWIGAGTEIGGMVCPTGNARCGDSPVGPPSWEAPSWPELVALMDRDLETAIAKVDKKNGGLFLKSGAVLTGYSRGAFAAPVIARAHPGRWPYLVLIEANAPLTAATLRASGVRAVALVAGERGTEITGMRKTEADLTRSGFPAKLFVMRRTGHPYSDDMEDVMHAALAFVLAGESSDAGAR